MLINNMASSDVKPVNRCSPPSKSKAKNQVCMYSNREIGFLNVSARDDMSFPSSRGKRNGDFLDSSPKRDSQRANAIFPLALLTELIRETSRDWLLDWVLSFGFW